MPLPVVFEHNGLGVLVTPTGEMNMVRFCQQTEDFYSAQVLEKLRYRIVDLREVENVEIDLESIQTLAETDKAAAQICSGLKIAIVVNPGVMEAIAQIYQRHAKHENLKTQVFNSLPAARAWVADCADLEASA